MVADFDAELERGKEKIAQMKKQARSLQEELDDQADVERHEFFFQMGLSDFPNLKEYPTELEEIEKAIFKVFVSTIKEQLPKVIPYVEKFHYESRDIDEASLSDMTRTPFGQYLYTEFLLTGIVRIPGFSTIKINWESRFNREFAFEAQEVAVHLEFTYEKAYTETKMIYWDIETDWEVALAKAKDQCGPVEAARSKGYMELK